MKKQLAGNGLAAYNSLMRENDDIYRTAIRTLGLPDGAMWILYALRADGRDGIELTQSEICHILYQPKQTTNSALKKLEGAGYLELRAGPDRRSKYVRLTPAGEALARQTADRLIEAENRSFSQLTEQEQETFLRLFRKLTDLFRETAETLENEKHL